MRLFIHIYRCAYCGEQKDFDVMAKHSLADPSHVHEGKTYVFELIATVKEAKK